MTLLKWANAAYIGIIYFLAYVAVALLVAITGWISLEVISRLIGLGILRGSVEFTEYALFNMAFLAAPWVLHQNAHVRVLILVEQLPEQSRLYTERAIHLFAAGICLILLYYAVINLNTSIERGQSIFGELVFPEWYMHWQVPLAFALLAIGFVKHALASNQDHGSAEAIKE